MLVQQLANSRRSFSETLTGNLTTTQPTSDTSHDNKLCTRRKTPPPRIPSAASSSTPYARITTTPGTVSRTTTTTTYSSSTRATSPLPPFSTPLSPQPACQSTPSSGRSWASSGTYCPRPTTERTSTAPNCRAPQRAAGHRGQARLGVSLSSHAAVSAGVCLAVSLGA
jgi:hypothetical protein